jgi:dTDP-4-dehydrorhamnose reductase
LRTNVFGPSRNPARRSLSDWLVAQLRAQALTTVFEDVLFSPLSLQTLSTLLTQLVIRRTAGVFNLGSHCGMSKADFAHALAGCLGMSTACLQRTQSGTKGLLARRPVDMRLNVARFEQAFGISLPTLQQEIALMRNCREYQC